MIPYPRFEIQRKRKRWNSSYQFWVVLYDEDGNVLSTSEKYDSDIDALNNIELQLRIIPGLTGEIYRDY